MLMLSQPNRIVFHAIFVIFFHGTPSIYNFDQCTGTSQLSGNIRCSARCVNNRKSSLNKLLVSRQDKHLRNARVLGNIFYVCPSWGTGESKNALLQWHLLT